MSFCSSYHYFIDNNFLYEYQDGFRFNYSTGMVVETVVNNILQSFENRFVIGMQPN